MYAIAQFYFILFIYSFLVVPGLHWCMQAFSCRSKWELLSCCGAPALGHLGFSSFSAQAQELWCTGLVVMWYVGSFQTRDWTWVPCTGRWMLNHWTTWSASLVVQMVKNLPAVQETRVWFLGWEDPLEKEMATHSSILAWRIPWTEEPSGLQSKGSQRVGHNWRINTGKAYSSIFWKVRKLRS